MRFGLKLAGVLSLTAALAWLGLESGPGAGHAPAVWWANAALVSIILLDAAPPSSGHPAPFAPRLARFFSGPRRRWPLLLAAGYAGVVAAHLLFRGTVAQAVLLSACDIGESAIAVYAIAIACRDSLDLTRQRQLLQFVAFAVLLAPLLASFAAGVTLHSIEGRPLAVALRWFPPRALGMSAVPPLVFGLARRETRDLFRPGRLLNTLLCLLAVGAGTAFIFTRSEFALLFLVLPPLLFLVLHLGLSGGSLGCVLIAAIGTAVTVGPHDRLLTPSDEPLEHRILLLQLFLATAVLSVSVVAVVFAQLRRTSREVHESELRYRSLAASMEMLASIDPLTRVANRRRFDEALQLEWQRALRNKVPLSLVLFDADFFKAYNDHYGHLAGDECLRKIAEKMNEMARRPADLVARFGGEEFGLVLPETAADGALLWAERLRQSIEELGFSHPTTSSGRVTISGGCATMVPAPLITPIDLLQAADAALYQAKQTGRNRIVATSHAVPLSPVN